MSDLDGVRIQLTAYHQSEIGADLCTIITAKITRVLDEWEPHYPSSGRSKSNILKIYLK